MALNQLSTPTIKPPTSLDLLNQEDDEQKPAATSLAPAPSSLQTMSATTAPAATSLSAPSGTSGVPGLAGPDVSTFARNQMANPSRYDSSIVRQGVDLINAELEDSQKRGTADMDEFYSSRGLVGSNVEAQGRADFLSQLDRTKNQRMFDLVREMANTYAQDVGTAGNLGLGARAQELQLMGMNRDDAYRYAVLEQSGSQFGQQMQQRESEFARQHGLSGQQLQLEAQRLQQEAQLSGRELDIREATSQAEIGLRAQQLAQQAQTEGRTLDLQEARLMAENEQFDASMAMQREQFAERLGLDRQQLDLQREEMTARYADSQANRLHQLALQEGDQEFQRYENALNRALETRSLDLQQAGLDAETAWREADRLLQQQLETRALDLQEQGIAADQAYREAALQLDREQMQQAGEVANQQAALSAADIYLRALAAGAGDFGDFSMPQYPTVGGTTGGTTGGTSGSPLDGFTRSQDYLRSLFDNPAFGF